MCCCIIIAPHTLLFLRIQATRVCCYLVVTLLSKTVVKRFLGINGQRSSPVVDISSIVVIIRYNTIKLLTT